MKSLIIDRFLFEIKLFSTRKQKIVSKNVKTNYIEIKYGKKILTKTKY